MAARGGCWDSECQSVGGGFMSFQHITEDACPVSACRRLQKESNDWAEHGGRCIYFLPHSPPVSGLSACLM